MPSILVIGRLFAAPFTSFNIARAKAAGAIGSKALGASGGGCVLVIAAMNRVAQVRAAIEPLGEILPFTIAKDGVERCA